MTLTNSNNNPSTPPPTTPPISNSNNNSTFRGLPPLRGGSGTSSFKGGTGKVPTNTNLRKRNILTAGVLLFFVGTIYVTALRKMTQVRLFILYFIIFLIILF